MDFRILGPLEVGVHGRPVTLGGPKQRALLAALLMRPGESVSADTLIDELWAGADPDRARKALQVRVSQLRKRFAAAGAPGVIATEATGYSVAVGPDQLDLTRFERLRAEGRAALAAGDARRAEAALTEALSLWRGPPLAELSFEPFAQAELARLEEVRLAALEERYEAALALGRHSELVPELEAVVTDHPLRERLREKLMLALYRCGRQADALAVYRAGRAVLVEELGLEPGRSLRELEQAILVQDPALDLPRPHGEPVPTTPFVGRRRELDALRAALEESIEGHGRLVLVGGEPGAGKSRLADELARIAAARGYEVAWGRCWEAGGAPAYWPWVQLLRAWVGRREDDSVREAMGDRAAELAQLLPELHERLGPLPEPGGINSDGARFRLFDAVVSVLCAACRERPLLIVIDDLHAADPSSLLLLELLAGRLDRVRLCVVAAYRTTEAPPGSALTSTLAQLLRESAARRLVLAGLSEDEVASYIAITAEGEPPASLAAAVHGATAGNPLFVCELARLLDDEGALEQSSAEALPIPAGVREVIARRVNRLPDACTTALEQASVLGREFQVTVLAGVAEAEAEELLGALDDAREAALVSDVGATAGRLRFSHDVVRDALYEGLGAARRAALHRRAAEVLLDLHEAHVDPHLAEIAHHFLRAVPAGDEQRAVEFARRAARRAARMHAYEEAARLFAAARGVVDATGGMDRPAYCDLLLELGDAILRAGDTDGAKAVFVDAAAIARELPDPERLGRAALGYGGRLVWLRSFGDVRLIDLLEEALDALPGDSALRVGLLARLSGALRDVPGREGDRDVRSAEAVRVAERLGDQAALAHALDGRYAAIWHPGNPGTRLELARRLIRVARAIGDRERLHHGYIGEVIAHLDIGEAHEARAGLRAMRRLASELCQPAQLWITVSGEAMLAQGEGRLDQAEALIEEAYEHGRAAVPREAGYSRAVQLGLLRRNQGRQAEAIDLIESAAAEFATRPICLAVLAALYADTSRVADAVLLLDQAATDNFARFLRDNEWLAAMCLLAEAASAIEDAERADLLYEALVPFDGRVAVSYPEVFLGAVARLLGLLAGTLGRHEDAERHLDDAIATNRRIGAAPAMGAAVAARERRVALRQAFVEDMPRG